MKLLCLGWGNFCLGKLEPMPTCTAVQSILCECTFVLRKNKLAVILKHRQNKFSSNEALIVLTCLFWLSLQIITSQLVTKLQIKPRKVATVKNQELAHALLVFWLEQSVKSPSSGGLPQRMVSSPERPRLTCIVKFPKQNVPEL